MSEDRSAALDPALQNERTALAWRRTALSLLIAAATMAKVASPHARLGAIAWIVFGVPAAGALLVLSSRGYRSRQFDAGAVAPWPLILVGAMTVVGMGGLSIVSIYRW